MHHSDKYRQSRITLNLGSLNSWVHSLSTNWGSKYENRWQVEAHLFTLYENYLINLLLFLSISTESTLITFGKSWKKRFFSIIHTEGKPCNPFCCGIGRHTYSITSKTTTDNLMFEFLERVGWAVNMHIETEREKGFSLKNKNWGPSSRKLTV